MPVIDLYDTEIIEAEKVLDTLSKRNWKQHMDLDAFDREIKDRFAQIGLVVEVKWWHTNVENVKMPEVEIVGRTERHEFDHDRLRHEVVNDVLELGTGGVIKMDKEQVRQIKETEEGHKKQHRHGQPHDHGDGNAQHDH